MVFSFARIGAALAMRIDDYYAKGGRGWAARLHEKGGNEHSMSSHHALETTSTNRYGSAA